MRKQLVLDTITVMVEFQSSDESAKQYAKGYLLCAKQMAVITEEEYQKYLEEI